MKRTAWAVAAFSVVAAGFSASAAAQKEQFVPANFYWVGPYAPGGSGCCSGTAAGLAHPCRVVLSSSQPRVCARSFSMAKAYFSGLLWLPRLVALPDAKLPLMS